MPGSKKMILVQPLGWGERRFRHTPPPRPLPSTGQMRDLWVGSCEGYLLALQVPSSLFRKTKTKTKTQQLRMHDGDVGVESQRAHKEHPRPVFSLWLGDHVPTW